MLGSFTAICKRHKDGSGIHQTTTQSPLTMKHFHHHGTKICVQAEKKYVSSVCSRWVTAYFTSASAAKRVSARCLLSGPKKITGPHNVNSNCDVSRRYGWDVTNHSPYSTDLAPCDPRNLQQTPIRSKPSLPGYRHMTSISSTSG